MDAVELAHGDLAAPEPEPDMAAVHLHAAAQAGRLRLFHLMREALAPLVEAVLLVDRALYLTQQLGEGAVVRLFPVFDPALRCADRLVQYCTPVACCS